MYSMKRIGQFLAGLACIGWHSVSGQEQSTRDARVYAIGALSEVRKGDLEATTAISKKDDIAFLFGAGPNDSLRGEVTIIDGEIYLAQVNDAKEPSVRLVDAVRAPYFVLTEVEHWTSSGLPEHVQTLKALEGYLQMAYHMNREPFAFMLHGKIAYLKYHIAGFPADQAAAGQDPTSYTYTYELEDTEVKIIGFYSPSHKGIFTNEDSNVRLHFISADKKYSGHIDELKTGQGEMKLLLPFKPKDK